MSGGNFPRRPLSIACPRGPEARLLQRLQSLGDFGRAGQRDEGFASSSCRWTLGATSNGNLVPVVALSEPSAFAPAPASAPAPISLSTSSRAGPGPPQHPVYGGPSVQPVVSEACVLWHCVPCTHRSRSMPLLQAAD